MNTQPHSVSLDTNHCRVVTRSNWLFDIASLLVLFIVFYAIYIGTYPLFTPDEGRYSEVAREMVATGDYITPRLNGVAFLDKPALYYWLQASAIHLFGLKEAALRFWPALLGIIGALISYMTGRLLFDRRAGIISAIILATSPLYYGAAHYANLDLEVAVLIGCSLMCFISAVQLAQSRFQTRLLLAAYVFAGLAALTKGLIGIVFPIMIIGTWILLLNRWYWLRKMYLMTGLCLFALIVLPWYVLVQKANPEFLHFFFVTQQVSRFLTTQDFNSKAAVWFYLPIVFAGFFPWSVLLVQAIASKIKLVWQDRQRFAADLFLLLWLMIVFVFFSIPRSKTVGYILPIFPVMALLVGSYVSQMWYQVNRLGIRLCALFFVIASNLTALVLLIAPYFTNTIHFSASFLPFLHGMIAVLFVASFIVSYALRQKDLRWLFTSFTVAIMSLLLVFISGASALNDKSIKPFALELNALLKPSDEVAVYYKYYQDLPIYLQRRITIVANWHATDILNKDNWLREMWYGMVFQNTQAWLIEDAAFFERWNGTKRLYVLTDRGYYKQLKNKLTLYKVSEHNDVILLTNKPLTI